MGIGKRQERGKNWERRPLKQDREEIIRVYRPHSSSMIPHRGYGGLNKGLEHPRILVSTRHGEAVGILNPQRILRDKQTERNTETMERPNGLTNRADR